MNDFGGAIAREQGWYWQPISTAGLAGLLAGAGFLMLLLATDKDGFLMIVDSFNLVVHEIGHPLFGIFGDSAMLWGGTLAQLLLPLGIAIGFWYQRSALSMSLAGVWFFENFLNVARYMADARAQELPLVGGGEHDWTNILSRHGLLESDTAIASVVTTIGWIGMVGCVALAVVLWFTQREPEPSGALDRN
jgi:hypothetical protein